MGAWGTGNFENDTALDFLADMEEGEYPFDPIVGLLEHTAGKPGLIDSRQGEKCLVAAELVAAALGKPHPDQPELRLALKPNASLRLKSVVAAAHKALLRIIGPDSELRELWEQGGGEEYEEWVQEVRGLMARLEA